MDKWDKVRRILDILFTIAVVLTIVFIAVATLEMLYKDTGDPDIDKFASVFVLPFGVIAVTVLLIAERELYATIKYFLPGTERRTLYKNIFNGINLLVTSVFFVLSLVDVLFLTRGFFAFESGVFVAAVLIFSRFLCAFISAVKE